MSKSRKVYYLHPVGYVVVRAIFVALNIDEFGYGETVGGPTLVTI